MASVGPAPAGRGGVGAAGGCGLSGGVGSGWGGGSGGVAGDAVVNRRSSASAAASQAGSSGSGGVAAAGGAPVQRAAATAALAASMSAAESCSGAASAARSALTRPRTCQPRVAACSLEAARALSLMLHSAVGSLGTVATRPSTRAAYGGSTLQRARDGPPGAAAPAESERAAPGKLPQACENPARGACAWTQLASAPGCLRGCRARSASSKAASSAVCTSPGCPGPSVDAQYPASAKPKHGSSCGWKSYGRIAFTANLGTVYLLLNVVDLSLRSLRRSTTRLSGGLLGGSYTAGSFWREKRVCVLLSVYCPSGVGY